MVEIRFITDDELVDFARAVEFGFGVDNPPPGSEHEKLAIGAYSPGAQIAAFDHGRLVATFGSYDFDLVVPGGGAVPMAGTTDVSVHPTHRRRGLLTQMMRMHLTQAIERDQPVAGLGASDERIYGRFGYGVATSACALTVPGHVNLPPGPGDVTMRFVTLDEASQLLPPVYDQIWPRVAGHLTRSPHWWRFRHLSDPEHKRRGAGELRVVLAERDGTPAGYLFHRLRSADGAQSTVIVHELTAVDDDVRRALWHFVTNVDLFPCVYWDGAPVDDPVLVEADRPRSITRTTADWLWLRLLDVARALEARRYEHGGAITLGVTDPFLGRGGTFALEVTGGAATCKPTTQSAEIELDISDLGALYLGGVSAITLSRAGRLSGALAKVRLLDELFRTAAPPHCADDF